MSNDFHMPDSWYEKPVEPECPECGTGLDNGYCPACEIDWSRTRMLDGPYDTIAERELARSGD